MKKKLLLSFTLTTGMTMAITPALPMISHHATVQAAKQSIANVQSKPFTIPADDMEAYNKTFRVPANQIAKTENNGGQYQNDRTIDKAFDNNPKTFWETGKPNSPSFQNEIQVTFKKHQTIDRMTYATRQDGDRKKGFPISFEIHASSTDSGDNFRLIARGNEQTVTSDTVAFKFPKTKAKRIKFVFNEANQNWASASEIGFYHEDRLTDEMNHIFTDKTFTKLATPFKSIGKIKKLENLNRTHPLKAAYAPIIQTASDLAKKPALAKDYEANIRTLEQLGNPRTDAWNVKKQPYQLGSHLPTGLYYKPGEKFILDVDVADGDPLPQLVFDQNWDIKGPRTTTHKLNPGRNVITAPKDVQPGGVYFINEATPEEQQHAPRVSIKSGGESYPIFYSGKTDINTYKKELAVYKEKLDKLNKDGAIVVPNLATTVTGHVLITGKATDAYQSFVNAKTSPQKAADAWEDMMRYDYKLLGYTDQAKDPKHRTPKNRLHARAVTDGMYAGGGLIGIGYGAESVLFGEDLGWGVFHEAGHVIEMEPLRFHEMTNNIFSMANQERTGKPVRIETDDIFKALFDHYTSGKTLGFSYQKRPDAKVDLGMWEAHLMMWQLRIAFGEEFYTKVFTAGRDSNFSNGNTSGDRWARYGSDAVHYDLGSYFKRMGINISDDTLAYTAKYRKLDRAVQYADTNARLYKGKGFPEGYRSKIASVQKLNEGNRISIDKQGLADDLMGFEVYRNGKLIGYTNKDSYVDRDGVEEAYEIKAYDRTLRPARMSESRSR